MRATTFGGGLLVGTLLAGAAMAADGDKVRVWVVRSDPKLAGSVERAVEGAAAEPGVRLVDGSRVHRDLGSIGQGIIVPEFRLAPSRDWPKALAEDWQSGNDACVRRMGPLEGQDRKEVMLRSAAGQECARELRAALWNRWLDHVGAEEVVEVQVGDTQSNVSFYGSKQPSGRSISAKSGSKQRAAQSSAAAVKRLLAGEGTAFTRSAERTLPTPPAEGAAVSSLAVLDRPLPKKPLAPVPVPEGCSAVSPSLELEPGTTVLARAIMDRYAASVRPAAAKEGAPLKCKLRAQESRANSGPMGEMTVLVVDLDCGGAHHRGEGASDLPFGKHYSEVISSRLISSIFKTACQ